MIMAHVCGWVGLLSLYACPTPAKDGGGRLTLLRCLCCPLPGSANAWPGAAPGLPETCSPVCVCVVCVCTPPPTHPRAHLRARRAMTHLSLEVRNDALLFLDIMVSVMPSSP
jgi:hypothetical protein